LRSLLGAGHTLAGALLACGVFSPWEAARLEQAVRTGEGAGVLADMGEEALSRATRDGEHHTGLVYPLLVLALAAGVATLVGLSLLPALLPSLQLLGTVGDLPLAARLLLWAAPRWWAWLGPAGAVWAGLALCAAGRLGRVGDRVALALPGVGGILVWRERARLLDSLSRLSRGPGLTGEGARYLVASCGNGHLRRRMERAMRDLEDGLPAARAIARWAGLPPALAAQLAGAEAAGEGGRVCHEVACYCRSLERQSEKLTASLAGPLLTLLAGAVVALVALAVVQPLYLSLAGMG
jgi:general secretion pathway protein F